VDVGDCVNHGPVHLVECTGPGWPASLTSTSTGGKRSSVVCTIACPSAGVPTLVVGCCLSTNTGFRRQPAARPTAMCRSRRPGHHAQRVEATNWVTAYGKHVGTATELTRHSQRRPVFAAALPLMSGRCPTGYWPCLPRGPLDCDDLPSNRPSLQVTGSEPYGLDSAERYRYV